MLEAEDDVEPSPRSLTRSRTNSSGTLQAVSNLNSQTRNGTGNGKGNASKPSPPPASTPKSKPLGELPKRMKAPKQAVERNVESQKSRETLLSKTEASAMEELNIVTRRYYLAFLSNTMTDEPVRHVFPNMRHTHPQYKEAKARVAASYKSWKRGVLKQVEAFTERWIAAAKPEVAERRRNMTTFEELKKELDGEFCIEWAEKLFKFATVVIDFENLDKKAMRFVRCKYFIL